MVTNSSHSPKDPEDVWACRRKDGRDLVQDWALDKTRRGYTYRYVTHTEDLNMVNVDQTDFLLGELHGRTIQEQYLSIFFDCSLLIFINNKKMNKLQIVIS